MIRGNTFVIIARISLQFLRAPSFKTIKDYGRLLSKVSFRRKKKLEVRKWVLLQYRQDAHF